MCATSDEGFLAMIRSFTNLLPDGSLLDYRRRCSTPRSYQFRLAPSRIVDHLPRGRQGSVQFEEVFQSGLVPPSDRSHRHIVPTQTYPFGDASHGGSGTRQPQEYQVELVSGLDPVAKPRGKRPTGKLCNWPGCNDLHAVSPSVLVR